MSESGLGLSVSRYESFFPDLRAVESLNLNWDHGMDAWDDGRNFGMKYLYSVGNSGHHYVAACVIPDLLPENYPIALVNEEGYTADVFASSIKTWLPCYVVYQAGDWLGTEIRRKGWAGAAPLQWLEEKIERFLAEETALREALQGFSIPEMESILATLTTMLRQKDRLSYSDWQPASFYALIEKDRYVSQYRQLADSRMASLSDWGALIQRYPFYNKPLFHLFAGYPAKEGEEAYSVFASGPHSWRAHKPDLSAIPVDLAYSVFQRRIVQDTTGGFDEDLLECAAHLVYGQRFLADSPFSSLIQALVEKGKREIIFGDAFFEAGQRWERQGQTKEQRLQALRCYENAISFYGCEAEAWHEDALKRVRDLASTFGDPHYLAYLEEVLDDVE